MPDSARGFAPLKAILGYLWPYKPQLLGAGGALLFTAGATLALGRGVQFLIDRGFCLLYTSPSPRDQRPNLVSRLLL